VPVEGACSPTSATDRARRFEGHQVCHFQVLHLVRSDHRGVIENKQPAATIRYLGQGKLADSDPGGESAVFDTLDAPDKLPPNNQLVIYELPMAWALSRSLNAPERAVATFLDVAALDRRIGGANFGDLSVLGWARHIWQIWGQIAGAAPDGRQLLQARVGATTHPTISLPRLLNRRQRIRELGKSAA
jgi:hypothetical protein